MFAGWTRPVSLHREFNHLGWGDLFVCMHVLVHVCMYVNRCLQVEARHRQRYLLPSISTLIFGLESHTGTESSPVRLDWLASKSQRSFISVTPALRLQVCITVPATEMNLRPQAGSLPNEPSPQAYSSSCIIFFCVCCPAIEG